LAERRGEKRNHSAQRGEEENKKGVAKKEEVGVGGEEEKSRKLKNKKSLGTGRTGVFFKRKKLKETVLNTGGEKKTGGGRSPGRGNANERPPQKKGG